MAPGGATFSGRLALRRRQRRNAMSRLLHAMRGGQRVGCRTPSLHGLHCRKACCMQRACCLLDRTPPVRPRLFERRRRRRHGARAGRGGESASAAVGRPRDPPPSSRGAEMSISCGLGANREMRKRSAPSTHLVEAGGGLPRTMGSPPGLDTRLSCQGPQSAA
eukprot:364054-Chlamydomonas_euryale.AAC.7